MKKILITQKEFIDKHSQTNDSLEQSYILFFQSYYKDSIIMPVPNNINQLNQLLKVNEIDLVIFSGGNNINPKDINRLDKIDDLSPNRDQIEQALFNFSKKNNIPIIGICRGMQMLNIASGGHLTYNIKHPIGTHSVFYEEELYTVNSFHNHGVTINDMSKDYVPLIVVGNIVEAFISKKHNFLGLQWHPEREKTSFELFQLLEKKYIGLT